MGDEFLADHAEALLRLESDPERFSIYYRDFRRALTHRFPYKIFFRILHGAQDHSRELCR